MSASHHEYEPTRPLEPYATYEPTRPLEPYPAYQPYPEPSPVPTQVSSQLPSLAPYGYAASVDPRWQAYQASLYAAQKSRLAGGLLGIFLGALGVHNFYLGRTGVAVVQLLLTVLTLGVLAPVSALWAFIEAIMILAGASSFRTDAKGIPLRD